jgi:hypothetical protein
MGAQNGLLSTFDAVTVVLAALGATAVASAVFLILELSDTTWAY